MNLFQLFSSILICFLLSVSVWSMNSDENALLEDLNRIVSAQESSEWFVDQYALESILPDFMPSFCRVKQESVIRAIDSLKQQCNSFGSAQELFQSSQELTDSVQNALHCQRELMVLEQAKENRSGDCPFWIQPKTHFHERQSTMGRFVLSAESDGTMMMSFIENQSNIGGGGGARIFGSYRFSRMIGVLGGFGLYGNAVIQKTSSGQLVNTLVQPMIPFIVRFYQNAWSWDLETAAVSTYSVEKNTNQTGLRFGTTIGFSSLRVQNLLPWAGVSLAVERYFENPRSVFFLVGIRAAVYFLPKD